MLIHSLFHRLPTKSAGRDFVVGDIHGHRVLLDTLLDEVRFDPATDRLIALGDLIDRGPESAQVLSRVRDWPCFLSVRGNHEAMMRAAQLDPELKDCWDFNGGEWGDGYGDEQIAELSAIVGGMPLAIELPLQDGRVLGLVHAEVALGHSWSDLAATTIDDADALDGSGSTLAAAALWGRRRFNIWRRYRTGSRLSGTSLVPESLPSSVMSVSGVDLVVAGHSIVQNCLPMAVGNLLWIDTGAFLIDGRLTMIEPLEYCFWQARHDGPNGNGVCIRRAVALPAPYPSECS